jgi:hypothetical protein
MGERDGVGAVYREVAVSRVVGSAIVCSGPNVGDTQIKAATCAVQIRRCFKQDLWHVGSRDDRVYSTNVRLRQLVQERFPVGWHSACGSRGGLTCGMRVRRKQFHTFDHPLLLVIKEPVLTRLEAGNDRMPCCRRMLGCMLTRRTVTASDVPALRAPAEMKPPTFR